MFAERVSNAARHLHTSTALTRVSRLYCQALAFFRSITSGGAVRTIAPLSAESLCFPPGGVLGGDPCPKPRGLRLCAFRFADAERSCAEPLALRAGVEAFGNPRLQLGRLSPAFAFGEAVSQLAQGGRGHCDRRSVCLGVAGSGHDGTVVHYRAGVQPGAGRIATMAEVLARQPALSVKLSVKNRPELVRVVPEFARILVEHEGEASILRRFRVLLFVRFRPAPPNRKSLHFCY